MNPQDVIDSIDRGIADWTVSSDAMRLLPDAPEPTPDRPYTALRLRAAAREAQQSFAVLGRQQLGRLVRSL